jgi:hypothetical protein
MAEDTFTLNSSDSSHTFSGPAFAAVSKKCRRLRRRGVNSAETRYPLVDAFIAACERRPFAVDLSNIHNLHVLSEEWQVDPLRPIIDEFASLKGIIIPGLRDSITALIDHAAKDCVTTDDLLLVSEHLQQALDDPRLLKLPPEVLFDLIARADPETYDQPALLDFMMRLLERKPSAAIPLIMSVNLCVMGPAQRSALFQAKCLHRTYLAGHIACALSTAKKLTRFEQKAGFGRLFTQAEALRTKLAGEEQDRVAAVKRSLDSEIEKTGAQVLAKQKKINDLVEKMQCESAEFKREREGQAAAIQALRDELESLSELAAQSREQLNNQQSFVRSTIGEEIGVLSHIEDRLVPDYASDAYTDRAQQIDRQRAEIDTLFESLETLTQKKVILAGDIQCLKSRLFVKMVRDKLNFGEYIRQTEGRFEMLTDEPSVWGLTRHEAEEAEERLLEFEGRLDRLCPIRALQQSSVTSPSGHASRASRSRTAPISPTKRPDT